MLSKHHLACIGLVVAACVAASAALAQGAYPTKPIKIIAPVQPGGGVDLVARQVGERLSKALGQPVVIENQSGGGGIVGSQATARAAPDGYTLMVGLRRARTAPIRRCASCPTTRSRTSRRSRWSAARPTCSWSRRRCR